MASSTEASSSVPSSSMTSFSKNIRLRSSDGEFFIVGVDVAMLSVTIKNMIEDGCPDTVIPIINVDGRILSKVLDYCKRHIQVSDKTEIDSYDSLFLQVDQNTLFDLLIAANYLEIKTLIDLICEKVAGTIKDMTVKEIRKYLNITCDFKKKLRKENFWAHFPVSSISFAIIIFSLLIKFT